MSAHVVFQLKDTKSSPRIYCNAMGVAQVGTDLTITFGEYEPLDEEEVKALGPDMLARFPEKVRLVVPLGFIEGMIHTLEQAKAHRDAGREAARKERESPTN